MKTKVTQTSIAAYHTHDKKQQQIMSVAKVILRRTEAGQRTWDRAVWNETGILPNTVSARRNDLETKKTVNTYALVLANDKPQLSIFG